MGCANASERYAYEVAVGYLERALEALGRLPTMKSNAEIALDVRLSLRIALGATGDYRRLYEHLSLAEQDAMLIDDGLRLVAVCIAKTHLSISGDPTLKGAPTGHTLNVREVRASVGAGFVYPICGDMTTMPGLGSAPAASIIDFDEHGEIIGLS